MSNTEYQTKSNIQIECRISKIKLTLTFKILMSSNENQTKSSTDFEYRICNFVGLTSKILHTNFGLVIPAKKK